MKKLMVFGALMSASVSAMADIFAVFREEDGSTRWQYVANTSASLLIITLAIVLFFLIRAHLKAVRSNRALTEIKASLEDRVEQRTAVLQQTTEQLQAREAYIASILNSMPVMLIGLDQELNITQWNKKAEEVTGRPAVDVIGANLWSAYNGIPLTEEQVRPLLSADQAVNIKHTQRGQYTFDITLYPLDNQQTGIVILISDVTKQLNAETKLAERDKVSAMGELASAMAYDIALPINTIFSRVLSARQEIEGAELGELKTFLLQEVETVRQSAHQATAIAQNLLELARAHRDTKHIVNVPEIMDDAIQLASELYADTDGLRFRHIGIRRHYDAAAPAIACFPAELKQVFVRIMRNAFYALNGKTWGDDEKPWINIEIGTFFDSLWIKIEHNGLLLTDNDQIDIFKPYFSLSDKVSCFPVEHRLSYSYFIITDHHRGQMAVTSDEVQGTRFNIQLPFSA